MNHLIKFSRCLSRTILALYLIFAASFITFTPAHAASHYPSRADLNSAKYNVQAVGAYAKYAALASAIAGVEANNTTIDSLAATITDIDSAFYFTNQTPSELVSFARNLPFYKEYAYLRTLVNEINYLYNNYDYISTSTEAWKIPYIIDRAENAIEGCNLIFGTNRQNTTTTSQSSTNQTVALTDTTPYSAASVTVIAEYTAKADVLRSTDSTQLPRRHQSNSNANNTQSTSTSSASVSSHAQPTPADEHSSSTNSSNPDNNSSTTDSSKTNSPAADSNSDDSSAQNTEDDSQTLIAVAAHTSTAITAAGALFVVNRRLRKTTSSNHQ